MVKFMIETGREEHSTSWQKCQAKYVGGPYERKYLYEVKDTIVSTQWLKQGEEGVIQNAKVVRTVYELPEGTQVEIDYNGYGGPERFTIRLDSTQEVAEYKVGIGNLRSYLMRGRYIIVKDIVQEKAQALKASQEEGF